MRLRAPKKLIFGVHGVQEMFFRLAKKSVDRLNFKTKSVDKFQSKFCVLGPLLRLPDDK